MRTRSGCRRMETWSTSVTLDQYHLCQRDTSKVFWYTKLQDLSKAIKLLRWEMIDDNVLFCSGNTLRNSYPVYCSQFLATIELRFPSCSIVLCIWFGLYGTMGQSRTSRWRIRLHIQRTNAQKSRIQWQWLQVTWGTTREEVWCCNFTSGWEASCWVQLW